MEKTLAGSQGRRLVKRTPRHTTSLPFSLFPPRPASPKSHSINEACPGSSPPRLLLSTLSFFPPFIAFDLIFLSVAYLPART